jgi:hypothetical protein
MHRITFRVRAWAVGSTTLASELRRGSRKEVEGHCGMWWYYFQDMCWYYLLDTRSCKEVEDRHRRTLVLLSGLQNGLVCMPFPFHRRSRESKGKRGMGEGGAGALPD